MASEGLRPRSRCLSLCPPAGGGHTGEPRTPWRSPRRSPRRLPARNPGKGPAARGATPSGTPERDPERGYSSPLMASVSASWPSSEGSRLRAIASRSGPAWSRLAPPLGIAPLYQRTPLHLLSSPNPLPGCPTSVTGVPNKDHCVQRPVARSKHDQPTRINGP
jgi:hypothetical protein